MYFHFFQWYILPFRICLHSLVKRGITSVNPIRYQTRLLCSVYRHAKCEPVLQLIHDHNVILKQYQFYEMNSLYHPFLTSNHVIIAGVQLTSCFNDLIAGQQTQGSHDSLQHMTHSKMFSSNSPCSSPTTIYNWLQINSINST